MSTVLDTLLQLGEEISEAVAADDWSRVDDLVERRTDVAKVLGEEDERSVESDLSNAQQQEKVEALAAQNERLTGMLRERRDAIEEELTQIGQMRQAQESYDTHSTRSGALPPDLKG